MEVKPKEKPNFEPKHNSEYGKQEYWEKRFAQEDEYEWLVNYKQCRPQLLQVLLGENFETQDQATEEGNALP